MESLCGPAGPNRTRLDPGVEMDIHAKQTIQGEKQSIT